jgi:hypothetical protein
LASWVFSLCPALITSVSPQVSWSA